MERSSRAWEGWSGGTHTHTEAVTSACRDGGQRVENVAGTVVLSALRAADNSSAFASLGSSPNARPEYLEYNDAGNRNPERSLSV